MTATFLVATLIMVSECSISRERSHLLFYQRFTLCVLDFDGVFWYRSLKEELSNAETFEA